MSYITTKDDFERFVVDTLRANPFLAMISRYIRKVPTTAVPTAGVTYDPKTDDLIMYYNLDFFSGLTRDEAIGTFHHELNHIIWDHLSGRRRTPHIAWNIATDLTINSTITQDYRGKLPKGCFIPGQRPTIGGPEGKVKARRVVKDENGDDVVEEYERELSEDEKNLNSSFADMIENFPHGKASEWYFDRLAEWSEKNNPQFGEGSTGIDSFDDHGGWDKIPESQRDLVSGKVKSLVEKAVNHADSQSNGWGNIPSEIRKEIRRMVNRSVDWRQVLRYFVGSICRGDRTSSIKKINNRFPYIHPGTKRGYRAKVGIFIDQSGSVSDEALERVFGALSALSKLVDFDVYHFDTEVDVESKKTWKRGSTYTRLRTRWGGTNFQAVTDFVNDPTRRGALDGYIIVTDGECEKPGPSRVKRGWIIVPGRKMLFDVDEMVVNMDERGTGE